MAASPDLIARAKSGDRSAFEGLLEPLIDPAYRLAYAMLLEQGAAEDAVQDAAVRAWVKIGTVRDGSEFRPWFLKVVANQCRSHRRGRWYSVVRVANLGHLGRPTPDEVLATGHDLRQALLRMAPADRALLVLHYYHDLPLSQVAAVLGVSQSAAKSRLYRALRRIRPHVEVLEVGT